MSSSLFNPNPSLNSYPNPSVMFNPNPNHSFMSTSRFNSSLNSDPNPNLSLLSGPSVPDHMVSVLLRCLPELLL